MTTESTSAAKRSDISDRVALEACWPFGEPSGDGALSILSQSFPQKVAGRKLKQLSDRGLIDYGVSIAYPWRTPEGEAELRRLTDAN